MSISICRRISLALLLLLHLSVGTTAFQLTDKPPVGSYSLQKLGTLRTLTDRARGRMASTCDSSREKSLSTTALMLSNSIPRGGATDADNNDKSAVPTMADYSTQCSALFSNIRIPAALFAGAAAANAFALPLLPSDTLAVGLTKRLYALLLIGALSSELLAVVVSTTTMATLAYYSQPQTATSLDDFVRKYYDFEWITVVANFIFGMLSFVIALGMRARIVITCPIVARAALGIIVSSSLLALSFLHDNYKRVNESFFKLPFKYVEHLVKKSRKDPLFFLATVLMTATYIYIISKIPHVYLSFLAK